MAATSSSPSTLARTAWLTVVLLMPVGLLNYLDRQMLASMKFSVMADITSIANDANWGFMLGQFKWVYAVLSPVGGYLADRFSRRLTICGSLFVWSAVTWWTGHTTTYQELLWARSLMGISEAFYIPAALALIADFHTGRTRSRAVGMHQMAIYCGVIVGGFSGYVAEAPSLGWRFAFDACGVLGMLYTLPLVWLLRDPPKPERGPAIGKTSPLLAVQELLGNTAFILLVLYFTLPALAGWVVRDWGPAIVKEQFDIGQGLAGVAATSSWQIAAVFGALFGGWAADRWMRRHERGRIFVSAIGMALIIPAIFGFGETLAAGMPQHQGKTSAGAAATVSAEPAPADNASASAGDRASSVKPEARAGSLHLVAIAVAFLVLFGIGWGFFDCNNMPILAQVVRSDLRATGYGVMNLVSISCGGLADWGFGTLRDRHVPLDIIFGIFSATAIVSLVLVLLIRPRRELLAQDEHR